MDEEVLALLSVLRQATDRIKETMESFGTIGARWLPAIDYAIRQQDIAGLVRL